MLLKFLFLTSCILFLYTPSFHSQLLNNDQQKVVENTIRSQFLDFATNFPYNYSFNNICIVNKDTLYNPNGFHYVFKLKNGIAERLDISHFHGGNFNRYLFEWKNQLFAIGGYGFFTTNNNLQFFNTPLKEWTFKNTSGKQPQHILGLTFKHNNKIFSFNNYKSGNATTKDIYDEKLYVLNLNNMKWEAFKLIDNEIKFTGVNYHLEDYHLFVGKIYSLLLKPNSLNYIVLKNEEVGLLEFGTILKMNKNSLFIESRGSSYINKLSNKIDLDKIWKTNYRKIQQLHFTKFSTKINSYSNYFLIVLLSVITLIIGLIILKVKKSKNEIEENNNFTEIHQRLFSHQNNSFTTDELDVVLEIDHLEADSKKLKRHRIINDLNQTHTNFIERIKDNNDKRKYIYIINKTK